MATLSTAFLNPSIAMVPPPLPPGWTEHFAPSGQLYYHNFQTNESTYIRPLPTILNSLSTPTSLTSEISQKKKKKEKPLAKTPIPGTDWLRVRTTEGNVFYTHKEKKQSVWTVPEEIKDAVELLEKKESEEEAKRREEEEMQRAEAAKNERDLEVERVKKEVEEMVMKRKAEEPEPLEEVIITKKAKITEEHEESDNSSHDENNDDENEDEEDWQREAAAQLAAEAEEARRREDAISLQEQEEVKSKEQQSGTPAIHMPDRVDLSLEEAKALFKTLLREKDINPLLPWDTSLPIFVSDPRYVLLPSVSARRDAFDEYCRDRARELRHAKLQAEASSSAAKSMDPKDEFDRLLREEVKSTRTVWAEWRRVWKKDRRFWGWGRDDREREKRFREWIKELGEQKRAAAKKAETDFFVLLKEKGNVKRDSIWKDIKVHLHKDPRYDAVGSSSLREELFNTYVKTLSDEAAQFLATISVPEGGLETPAVEAKVEYEKNKRDRKEKAVKEREERVRAERSHVESQMARSRIGLDLEEGERDFKTLLTDAIRDPQAIWSSSVASLKTDARFTRSPLTPGQQINLFNAHVSQLRAKHINNLHVLFESHAPSLATPFEDLPVKSLLASLPAVKLGFNTESETDEKNDRRSDRGKKSGKEALREEFEKWQQDRSVKARAAFDEMLAENSFVEFWGRLNKIGGEGVDGGVKADEDDNDEGEGGGGKVDLKALAKQIDIREMERVLKNDKRYVMFDHVPEQRERWLRDHISHLTAPKLSVHTSS